MHDFHEDLKKMYLTAGVDGKPLVFLLADTEIVHEVLRARPACVASFSACAQLSAPRACVRTRGFCVFVFGRVMCLGAGTGLP